MPPLSASTNPVSPNIKIIAKHHLKIALIWDADDDVCECFSVRGEKKLYGKVFLGIQRTTFLIKDSTIRRIWRTAKVPGHVDNMRLEIAGF